MNVDIVQSYHALEDTISFPDFANEMGKDLLQTSECWGTSISRLVPSIRSSSNPLQQFQEHAESEGFRKFVHEGGLQNPTFKRNPKAVVGEKVYDNFVSVLQNQELDDSSVAIVFHGTKPINIPDILEKGLDPSRRAGQAHGPGEYFSKSPTVSVAYCHGGLSMLVFLVVVPKLKKDNSAQPPCDYVVVEDNTHQIPLGTLEFSSVDSTTSAKSAQMRFELSKQAKEVSDKQAALQETQYKALIIQLLIQNKPDLASEKYQKATSILSSESKSLISHYVHKAMDSELVEFYFPGLPVPLTAEQVHQANSCTLEDQKKQVLAAQMKLQVPQPADPPEVNASA